MIRTGEVAVTSCEDARSNSPAGLAAIRYGLANEGWTAGILTLERTPHTMDARSSIVGQASFSTNKEKLEKALICMEAALHLLDDADAPADIGAHLDLSICRLQEILPVSSSDLPRVGGNQSTAK